ncbi:hypothetical protein [Nocardia sp. NBC_00416]
MHNDEPGLFSHVPAEPEPYAPPTVDHQPLFLTATPEQDNAAPSDDGSW